MCPGASSGDGIVAMMMAVTFALGAVGNLADGIAEAASGGVVALSTA